MDVPTKQQIEAITNQYFSVTGDKEALSTTSIDSGAEPVFQPWIMDSGAGIHLCSNLLMFDTFTPNIQHNVRLADGSICKVFGTGTVKMETFSSVVVTLTNVFYIPSPTKTNLISLGTLESRGFEICMKKGAISVMKGSEVVMVALRANNMIYYLVSRTFTRKDHATLMYQQLKEIGVKGQESKDKSVKTYLRRKASRVKIGLILRMKEITKRITLEFGSK